MRGFFKGATWEVANRCLTRLTVTAVLAICASSAFADFNSERMARDGTSSCLRGQVCSASVGMVTIPNDHDASQCTGTLVASDLVATAAHCLPPNLRRAGADCRGRIYIHFVPAKGLEERGECSEIVFSSVADTDDSTPDIAFFKIAHASRRPFLPVSRKGIEDGVVLEVFKVDPVHVKGQVRGVQRRVTCTSAMNTMIVQTYGSPWSVRAQFESCEVIHGNSGSALVAADGTIRGIITGYLSGEKVAHNFAERLLELPRGLRFKDLAVGTIIGCLDLPDSLNFETKPQAVCSNIRENSSLTAINAALDSQAREQFDRQIQATTVMNNFDWTTKSTNDKIECEPTCLKNENVNISNANIGINKFLRVIRLDNHARFMSAELIAAGADSHLSMKKVGESYSIRIDDQPKIDIPVCQNGQSVSPAPRQAPLSPPPTEDPSIRICNSTSCIKGR